jgi:hypothetical protein
VACCTNPLLPLAICKGSQQYGLLERGLGYTTCTHLLHTVTAHAEGTTQAVHPTTTGVCISTCLHPAM